MATEQPTIGVEQEVPAGTVITGFEAILPVSDDVCRQQIRQNLKLGLPNISPRNPLTIIANGPSAHGVNLKAIYTHTLAVNGSIKLFLDQGIFPTYWAACDPQECVADFLPENPPHGTTYLLGSKCHPSVFHKLRNNDVLVWHLRDHEAFDQLRVPLCCSITLCATWLMYRQGYTDFDYWGWDGCFMDGKHHAAHEADWSTKPVLHMNYGGTVVDGLVVGGRDFSTTRTWAAEAKAAEQFFQLCEYFDIRLKINGNGMFECCRHLLMDDSASPMTRTGISAA